VELSVGVIATSRKKHEHRLPIHPRHLDRIDAGLRRRIFLEQGYGLRHGYTDDDLAGKVGGLRTREQLIADCDVVVLPKPVHADVAALRPGQVLWGWPHCVQDAELTQLAIDRRLTMIAWEAMNHWTPDGAFSLHVFHMNNELAGYCSVLHALQLRGTSGVFGPRLRAAVISFGATARGATAALLALGVHDVTVLTHRSVPAVASPMPPARLVHYDRDDAHPARRPALIEPERGSLSEYLARHDIVVNCILQDTDDPLMFVTNEDLDLFQRGSLIVDVSCDEGMGFEWARPTSFDDPMFTVGQGVHYYAFDHSPTYLWNSATWEISAALIPHLGAVMSGPDGWERSETIRRAIEIRDGVVQNPRILSFQGREPEFPHRPRRVAGGSGRYEP
jgi:alanine dehydrogenase